MAYSSQERLSTVQAHIARSSTLASHVHLPGYISHEQLAAFYSAADLFVLGSHREGSGYALIEALACGAIPIVTNIPSFRALTGNGAVGTLWPAGDAAAFAGALIRYQGRDLNELRVEVVDHF